MLGLSSKRSPVRGKAIVLSLMALIIIGAPIANWQSLRSALRTATTHEPERFSELFFTDYPGMSKLLVPGTRYDGAFTVTNHEFAGFKYEYLVKVLENGVVVDAENSSFELADRKSLTIPFTYQAKELSSQVEVQVELVNKHQMLHFKAAT